MGSSPLSRGESAPDHRPSRVVDRSDTMSVDLCPSARARQQVRRRKSLSACLIYLDMNSLRWACAPDGSSRRSRHNQYSLPSPTKFSRMTESPTRRAVRVWSSPETPSRVCDRTVSTTPLTQMTDGIDMPHLFVAREDGGNRQVFLSTSGELAQVPPVMAHSEDGNLHRNHELPSNEHSHRLHPIPSPHVTHNS